MITEQIPAALDGERVDRVVALLTDASRGDAAELVRSGAVRVDDVVTTSGKLRLRAGQRLDVDEARLPASVRPEPDPAVAVSLVHVDADIAVIDKPPGLVVHPGAGHPDGTLVNGLLALFPEIATVGEPHRPGIVHRLDVGTSGLLVVARTQTAYDGLVAAMVARRIDRRYRTLVWGSPASPTGVVDAPIGRDHRNPLRMAVVVDGKPARTSYRLLAEFDAPVEAASLECRLETGRTHQIRVHLAAIGHPVVGDGTYGGVRHGIEAPRPFLHSATLALRHPESGEELTFTSVLPDDLAAIEAGLHPVDPTDEP